MLNQNKSSLLPIGPPRLEVGKIFLILGLALTMLSGITRICNLPGARADDLNSSNVPNFWNFEDSPTPSRLELTRPLRFALDPSFPPFAYEDENGRLRGFNVELAREICLFLDISCTLEIRPWNELIPDLMQERSDVLISGHRPDAVVDFDVDLTQPYFRLPARFIGKKGEAAEQLQHTPSLEGARIGVISGSAHAAYAATFFPLAEPQLFVRRSELRQALHIGDIQLIFDDASAHVYWLTGTGTCCTFIGGPYLDSSFFGEGMSLLVRNSDRSVKNALEYALFGLFETGQFSELYMRHFPISVF